MTMCPAGVAPRPYGANVPGGKISAVVVAETAAHRAYPTARRAKRDIAAPARPRAMAGPSAARTVAATNARAEGMLATPGGGRDRAALGRGGRRPGANPAAAPS